MPASCEIVKTNPPVQPDLVRPDRPVRLRLTLERGQVDRMSDKFACCGAPLLRGRHTRSSGPAFPVCPGLTECGCQFRRVIGQIQSLTLPSRRVTPPNYPLQTWARVGSVGTGDFREEAHHATARRAGCAMMQDPTGAAEDVTAGVQRAPGAIRVPLNGYNERGSRKIRELNSE
jgi:hypothetical protein